MAAINVCMIGPSGCGKTSVLAVMLHEVQQFTSKLIASGKSNFDNAEIRPSLVVSNSLAEVRLTNAYPCLERLVTNAVQNGGKVDVGASGLIGTGDAVSTPLRLTIGRHSTEIVFWDFPGGFFSQKQIDEGLFDADDVETWEGIITHADVLMIAIDASLQLGEKDLLKDQSYYKRITELVKRSVAHSVTTVVFVPVKCEHLTLISEYNGSAIEQRFDKSSCEALQLKVRERFRELVSYAENPETWGNVDAFFMPMITVGGVKYIGNMFDPVRQRGIVTFSAVLPEKDSLSKTPFAPKNCAKILALCLLRAYKQLVAEWKADKTIWESICSLFSDHTPFEVFFDKLVEKYHFYPMMARKEIEIWEKKGDADKVALWKQFLEAMGNVQYDGCECLNACYSPLSV